MVHLSRALLYWSDDIIFLNKNTSYSCRENETEKLRSLIYWKSFSTGFSAIKKCPQFKGIFPRALVQS